MQQTLPVNAQVLDYITLDDDRYDNEKAVIFTLYKEISRKKVKVNNKDLIAALIEKLQTENDLLKLDIYRQALEMILQRTPDDGVS